MHNAGIQAENLVKCAQFMKVNGGQSQRQHPVHAEDILFLIKAGLQGGKLIEMLEFMTARGGSAIDIKLMSSFISADCSLKAITLMLDLLDNKCKDKQLQEFFNQNKSIKNNI